MSDPKHTCLLAEEIDQRETPCPACAAEEAKKPLFAPVIANLAAEDPVRFWQSFTPAQLVTVRSVMPNTYTIEQLFEIVQRCEERRIDARVNRLDLGDVLGDLMALDARPRLRTNNDRLVGELRNESKNSDHCGSAQHLFGEAADEIVRLTETLEATKAEIFKDLAVLLPSVPTVNKPSHRYPRQMVHGVRGVPDCSSPCPVPPAPRSGCGDGASPYTTMRTRTCPGCNGKRGHYEQAVAHTDVWHTCDLCKGHGVVIADPPEPAVGTSGCTFCQHIAPGRHETCVICGASHHAGLGHWVVHHDDPNDNTPVCTGTCWRTYQTRKNEQRAEQELLEALARWGNA